jgi:hypothetical protein
MYWKSQSPRGCSHIIRVHQSNQNHISKEPLKMPRSNSLATHVGRQPSHLLCAIAALLSYPGLRSIFLTILSKAHLCFTNLIQPFCDKLARSILEIHIMRVLINNFHAIEFTIKFLTLFSHLRRIERLNFHSLSKKR